ncbi:MAG: LCP family protein [Chloroflexi bacterium]|nr:LCP family protein [Chloroflexota bacterium]
METRRTTSNRARVAPRKRRRPTLPRWAFAALAALFLLATGVSALLIFTTVRDFVVALGPSGPNLNLPAGTTVANVTPGPNGPGGGGQPVVIPPIQAQQWNGTDRVTVLVMGIDQRAGETDTAYRTDSMLLLTLDPVGRTAGMLSIPRDLYVEIPGFPDRDKITTANFKGDAYHLPGGGAQLAVDTVQLNLGIRVDFYVRVNFTAFESLVNQIGGIDINNPQEINDPEYPDCCFGYDPFYLPAGQQHLNGATALKFARTRHTTGDDFGRAERQQIVVMAVRDKLLSADNLPALIANAPQLLATLQGSYTTNLSPEQMLSLALLAKDIPRESITSAVIDQQYIADFYTTADNQQVLILNIEKFRELRDTMFYTPLPPQLSVPNASGLLANEAARVEVQNGSLTPGLAASASDYLIAQGVNVVQVGNADRSDYASTIIIDYTGKPYTAKWLADTFHVSPSSILSGNNPGSQVDVRLILGADFVLPGTP